MKFTKKYFYNMISIAIMLAFLASITAIRIDAASSGAYLASVTTNYRSPFTGEVEDSGGESSYTIGQAMTKSITASQALVEVATDGSVYVTIRLKLTDNISNIRFQTSPASAQNFTSVTTTITSQDDTNHTADYRMKVQSTDSVIRATIYVDPMGRDVTFFITLGSLTSGSGDFVTGIVTTQQTQAQATQSAVDNSQTQQAQQVQQETTTTVADTKTVQQITQETTAEQTETLEEDTQESETQSTVESTEVTESLSEDLMAGDTAVGLLIYDEQGNLITEDSTETSTSKAKNIPMIIEGILAVVVCIGSILFFAMKKIRKRRK